MPTVLMSDLDDTLIHAYQPPAPEMVAALRELMQRMPVAIVSGASFIRIKSTILDTLVDHLTAHGLYVFSDAATQCFLYNGTEWEKEYSFTLTDEERANIRNTFVLAIQEAGLSSECDPGKVLFLRDTKVSFVGVNSAVSQEEKMAWDPTRRKREALKAALEKHLPDFDICIGGSITLDVTKKGINKAYGVQWLAKHLGVAPQTMLFLGDAFYDGGNDAMVIPTGIQTKEVSGPEETLNIIRGLLGSA